ncbi:MAG TPA: hypothetical protein VKE40_09945 [Gemmataceae bacterium]|nr:hypothetical protein [Gemmataceae bacterium]
MRQLYAWAFKTDLTLGNLFARLNARGPWLWSMRDSESWGDYMSTRALPDFADPEYVMVKIFVELDRHVIQVRFESDRPDALSRYTDLKTPIAPHDPPVPGRAAGLGNRAL